MHLNDLALKNTQWWQERGYRLPEYSAEAMREQTRKEPVWVHFGAGNIFRAFVACLQQRILDSGDAHSGIIVAEGFDAEIVEKVYRPMDNHTLAVTLKADGSVEKEVVSSIAQSLTMEPGSDDWEQLRAIFRAPSLQMASFTITEKGYRICGPDGELLPAIRKDLEAGPAKAESYIGRVAALAYERYLAGKLPVSFVSMDNCSHNGSRVQEALTAFADGWERNGLVEKGFGAYISDRKQVGFPWSMIDKITPRPDAAVVRLLEQDGFEDTQTIVTGKGSYVAPFVNAEQTQYLVIEDWFPNGHPAIEKAGVLLTSRETVDKVERMKVCTCLNPLHTALAVYGCLLGYTRISEEMKDEDLKGLIRLIGYREALLVVENPGVLNPKEFIDTVVNIRFPNVFMPDTPQRIATDTSQKLAIRFGETIKAYLASDTLKVAELKGIPLVLAGWCRYLMGTDDNGNAFALNDDPMLPELREIFKHFTLGSQPDTALLRPLLSNPTVFGVDLYEAGLGETVEQDFSALCAGPGAVRKTLHALVESAQN